MPLTSDIGGVVPIAPTPFHPDGRIDEVSLDRMTDFFGSAGVDGLTDHVVVRQEARPHGFHDEHAGELRRLEHLPSLRGVARECLLDEDVLARLDGEQCVVAVLAVR